MRFGTQDGRFVLMADGRVLDVHAASEGKLPWEPLAALERWDEVRAFAASADWGAAEPLDESRLGPPVPRPRQVFAVALNYRPHAAEAGFVPPDAPLVFTKFPTCVTDAGPVLPRQVVSRLRPDWPGRGHAGRAAGPGRHRVRVLAGRRAAPAGADQRDDLPYRHAVRGLLSSAGGARAIQAAGEHAVRDVLRRTLAQFQDPQTRVVTLQNTFRWVAARR